MENTVRPLPPEPLLWFGFVWVYNGRQSISDVKATCVAEAWVKWERAWLATHDRLPDEWWLEDHEETKRRREKN